MKRIAATPGKSASSAASAPGPCSARRARSVISRTSNSGRCARIWARSADLRAALTTKKQVIAAIGHHQVVQHAALVIGEHRVALSARRQPQHIHRHKPLQRQSRLGPAHNDLSHMADIEQGPRWRVCEYVRPSRPSGSAPASRSPRRAPFLRQAPDVAHVAASGVSRPT